MTSLPATALVVELFLGLDRNVVGREHADAGAVAPDFNQRHDDMRAQVPRLTNRQLVGDVEGGTIFRPAEDATAGNEAYALSVDVGRRDADVFTDQYPLIHFPR
jgi:hypothetical protein